MREKQICENEPNSEHSLSLIAIGNSSPDVRTAKPTYRPISVCFRPDFVGYRPIFVVLFARPAR